MYFYRYEAYMVILASILTIYCPISIMLYALETNLPIIGPLEEVLKVSSVYYCVRPGSSTFKNISQNMVTLCVMGLVCVGFL